MIDTTTHVQMANPANAFLESAQPLFINGAPQAASNPTPIIDPSHDKILLNLGQASGRDVDRAVEAAQKALVHPDWARMPPGERALALMRWAELIERNGGVIAELETRNSGIPIALTRHMAVPLSASLLRYYAGWTTKMGGEVIPANPRVLRGAQSLTYTRKEPVGVVAQIVPWNFPLGLAILKIAPALAAGCTVVLKPSELTPLSALYVAKLAVDAGIPPGVFNVITGDAAAGAALVSHQGVRKIAFTGSTKAGKAILSAAAQNVTRVSLELGGKSPVIIFDDADLDLAIPGAAAAVFLLSGQNCMAGTRLFAHKKVHDRVVAGIESIAKSMTIGAAMSPDTAIGPLISRQHRDRVKGFVEAGLEEGATLVTGGRALDREGFFFKPTIFVNAGGTTVAREEIFGPVLSIQSFDDSDDLDSLGLSVNDTPYGLSGSVWTKDLSRAHRMAHMVEAGQVSINCHGAVDAGIPFGGYKQSGWGRDYGEAALDLYTNTKAITVRI